MSQEYKYKFVVLEVNCDKPKALLTAAIDNHIKELQANIDSYTKSKAYARGADIKICADNIVQLMQWRDDIAIAGSNSIFSASDLVDKTSELSKVY
jgi:hypothetical protein